MYELIRYLLFFLVVVLSPNDLLAVVDCNVGSTSFEISDSDVIEYMMAFQKNNTNAYDSILVGLYCYTSTKGNKIANSLIGLDIAEKNLVDRDEKFVLVTNSYLVSKQNDLEETYFRSMDLLATLYNSNLLLDKSLAMIQEYLSYALSVNNGFHITKSRMLLGRVMRDLGKHKIALHYLDRVISPNNGEKEYPEPKAWAYLHKGVTLRLQGRHHEAIETFKRGELYCLRNNLPNPLSFISTETSRTLTENNKYPGQVKEVLLTSLEKVQKKNLKESQAGIYTSLADVSCAENQIDSCLHFLKLAYQICNENAYHGSLIYLSNRLISMKEQYPDLDIDLVKIHTQKSKILSQIVELSYLESKNHIYDELLEKALQESEVLEKKMKIIKKDNLLLLVLSVLFIFLCGIIFVQYFNRIKLIKDVKSANSKLSEANEEMQVMVDNLSSANDQLSNFAAIVAHDLKSPLGSMNRLTQLVALKIKHIIPANEAKNLNIVIDMMKNLAKLVDQMLTFSVINKDLPDSEQLDLTQIVNIVELNLNQQIESKNIEIVKAINMTGYWHKTLIVQVLQNVMSNAVKFSRPGSKIYVSCEKIASNKVRIIVEDQGMGIEKKYLKSMFYIFSKFHSNAQNSGSGIGLATCKKIVDFYQGRIYAESELGKGTKIIIEIPQYVEKLVAA